MTIPSTSSTQTIVLKGKTVDFKHGDSCEPVSRMGGDAILQKEKLLSFVQDLADGRTDNVQCRALALLDILEMKHD